MTLTVQNRLWRAWYWTRIPNGVKNIANFFRDLRFFLSGSTSRYGQNPKNLVHFLRDDTVAVLEMAGHEVVRRRIEARDAGIGPTDPRYPNLSGVLKDWDDPLETESRQFFRRLERQGYIS